MLSQYRLTRQQGHHGPSFSDQSLALPLRRLAGPHGPGLPWPSRYPHSLHPRPVAQFLHLSFAVKQPASEECGGIPGEVLGKPRGSSEQRG